MNESDRPFITDEDIERVLARVENGLGHLEAAVPSLRREITSLRQALFPRSDAPGEAR